MNTEGRYIDQWLSTTDRVRIGALVCQGYGVEDISLKCSQPEWVVRKLIQRYRDRGELRMMLANGWAAS